MLNKRPRPAVDRGAAHKVQGFNDRNPTLTSPKPQAPIRASQVKAQGRMHRGQALSVTDGRTTIGRVKRYGDSHNGAKWLAYDTQGRVRGAFATMDAAIAALPAPKEEA
jgi:hypothetical protein